MVNGLEEIRKDKLLIVEGKEDQLFFEALLQAMNLNNIQVIPLGGKDRFKSGIRALALMPGFSRVKSMGIIRDADTNYDGAFRSICNSLRRAGLPHPTKPLCPSKEAPTTRILILPGDSRNGELEDVCLASIIEDPSYNCIESFFKCLRDSSIQLPDKISKAKVHAYLASKPDTGLRLGEAAKKGYFPFGNQAFDSIKCFLRSI